MFLNSICKRFFAIGKEYGEVVFLYLVTIVPEPQDAYTISARLQKVCDDGRPTFVFITQGMHPTS